MLISPFSVFSVYGKSSISKISKLIFLCPNLAPEFGGFSKKILAVQIKILLNTKISPCVFLLPYAYSENTGKVVKLSVYGEYGECRVVCGKQNRLRICRKNLCVDSKRHKTVYVYLR